MKSHVFILLEHQDDANAQLIIKTEDVLPRKSLYIIGHKHFHKKIKINATLKNKKSLNRLLTQIIPLRYSSVCKNYYKVNELHDEKKRVKNNLQNLQKI